jgi:hypothetical protein
MARLLQGLEEAFDYGCALPLRHTGASSGRDYEELFRAALASHLTSQELALVESYAGLQEEALTLARQDRLEQAGRVFNEVWERLRSASPSLEVQFIVQALTEPAEAYLHYKLQSFDRARELIFHAAALDRILVSDYGYAVMSAHLLQLGHNLLRIHVRLGEGSEAVHLAVAFLDYLELRREAMPYNFACARTELDVVPDTILEYYFDRICGEVALLLAGDTDTHAAELFRPLAHHATPFGCSPGDFGVHAHKWLFIKQLALDGEVETFLIQTANLLRLGRRSEPALLFATIVEAVGFCRSLGPEGLGLADRLAARASQFPDAPWAVRQMLCPGGVTA